MIDSQTNSASTKDWVRLTQNVRILAYVPGDEISSGSSRSIPLSIEIPKPHPQLAFQLQE